MHTDKCPSRYQVQRDADRDFGEYGADYHRYYDGCHDAERWHRDEMRRHEEYRAERKAAERREEERRQEEYYMEQEAQRAQEREYWREQEEEYWREQEKQAYSTPPEEGK